MEKVVSMRYLSTLDTTFSDDCNWVGWVLVGLNSQMYGQNQPIFVALNWLLAPGMRSQIIRQAPKIQPVWPKMGISKKFTSKQPPSLFVAGGLRTMLCKTKQSITCWIQKLEVRAVIPQVLATQRRGTIMFEKLHRVKQFCSFWFVGQEQRGWKVEERMSN